MRTRLSAVAVVTVVLAMALSWVTIGAFAQAANSSDPIVGAWKLDPEKSVMNRAGGDPVHPTRSVTRIIAVEGDGYRMNANAKADAAPTGGYFARFDGKEYPVADAPFDTIAMKRVNANTTTSEVRKKGGAYHQTTRHVVSKDGKTKTQTVKGTDADGKHVVAKLVYERQ